MTGSGLSDLFWFILEGPISPPFYADHQTSPVRWHFCWVIPSHWKTPTPQGIRMRLGRIGDLTAVPAGEPLGRDPDVDFLGIERMAHPPMQHSCSRFHYLPTYLPSFLVCDFRLKLVIPHLIIAMLPDLPSVAQQYPRASVISHLYFWGEKKHSCNSIANDPPKQEQSPSGLIYIDIQDAMAVGLTPCELRSKIMVISSTPTYSYQILPRI